MNKNENVARIINSCKALAYKLGMDYFCGKKKIKVNRTKHENLTIGIFSSAVVEACDLIIGHYNSDPDLTKEDILAEIHLLKHGMYNFYAGGSTDLKKINLETAMKTTVDNLTVTHSKKTMDQINLTEIH